MTVFCIDFLLGFSYLIIMFPFSFVKFSAISPTLNAILISR